MKTYFDQNQRFLLKELGVESLSKELYRVDKFIESSANFVRNSSQYFLFKSPNILVGRSVVGIDEIAEPFSMVDFGVIRHESFSLDNSWGEQFLQTNTEDFLKKLEDEWNLAGKKYCLVAEFKANHVELCLIAFENH